MPTLYRFYNSASVRKPQTTMHVNEMRARGCCALPTQAVGNSQAVTGHIQMPYTIIYVNEILNPRQ